MTEFTPTDPAAWKRKAMAFAIRAHRHLWGKNNEDPLVFLYNQGLTHEFSKSIYLGWNKFSQERPAAAWGFENQDKFILPAGIVFPHIIDKELLSIFILSMEDPGQVFIVPGSRSLPGTSLMLGSGESDPVSTDNFPEGLRTLQDRQGDIRIRIQLPTI